MEDVGVDETPMSEWRQGCQDVEWLELAQERV